MPVVSLMGSCYKKIAAALNNVFQNVWKYQDGLSQSKTTFGLFDAKGIASNGAGLFVVVGLGGRVATSTDGGLTWTYQTGLNNTSWGINDIYAIVWANSQFVIVGQNSLVATSPNGVAWTVQTSAKTVIGSSVNLYAIAWNGSNALCAAGANGTVISSTDGVTWTNNTTDLANASWPSANAIRAVAWFNGVWAIGGDNCSYAFGVYNFWTYQPAPSSGLAFNKTTWGTTYPTTAVVGFAYSGSVLLAFGAGGQIMSSPDATAWTYRGILAGGQGAGVWTGTTFIITTASSWYSTTDASTLTSNALPVTNYSCYVVGYDGGSKKLVAAGQQGAVWTSPATSPSFTYQTSLSSVTSVYGVNSTGVAVWAGNQFIVGGSYGRMAYSPDGVSWAYKNDIAAAIGGVLSSWFISAIANNGNVSLLSTSNGNTLYSANNGASWTLNSVSALQGYSIYGICVIPSGSNVNKFVIVGAQGRVAVAAADGTGPTYMPNATIAWNSTANTARAAASNGSMIIVVGNAGIGMYSNDGGNTWTKYSQLSSFSGVFTSSDNITNIVWNGSMFLATTNSGKVATSFDGLSWMSQPQFNSIGWGSPPVNVVWTGAQFVAVSTNTGQLATSSDGETWTLVGGGSSWLSLSQQTNYNVQYAKSGSIVAYSPSLKKYLFVNNGLAATWS